MRAGWRKQSTGRATTFIQARLRTLVPSPVGSWWSFILSAASALSSLIHGFCPNPKLPRLQLNEIVIVCLSCPAVASKRMPGSKALLPLLGHRIVLMMEIFVGFVTWCHVGLSCCYHHHRCYHLTDLLSYYGVYFLAFSNLIPKHSNLKKLSQFSFSFKFQGKDTLKRQPNVLFHQIQKKLCPNFSFLISHHSTRNQPYLFTWEIFINVFK